MAALPLSFLFEGGAFFISALRLFLKNFLLSDEKTADYFRSSPFSISRQKTFHFASAIKTLLLAFALPLFFFPNLILKAAENPSIRVVSLAPSLTEIICELGAEKNLVGITNLCDYPPEKLMGIQTVGSIGSFSAEKILSLKPDIVFAINSTDRAVKVLEKSGVKVICADPQSTRDIKNTVMLIGKLLGRHKESLMIVKKIESDIEEIKSNSALVMRDGRRLRIYIEIYYPPPWSASSSSFIGEMVEAMGFQNIFYDSSVGRKNYFPVAAEEVIARKPEVVLVLSGDERIKTRNGFEGLPAIKNNCVVIPFNRAALVRATPRMIREMLRLQKEQIIPLLRR